MEQINFVSKGYSSVEDMVRDLTDPEFAAEFSEVIRKKHAEPIVFEGVIDYDSEDGGQALIATLPHFGNMFVRLQSWDETLKHAHANFLRGKTVRVTVELINPEVCHAEAEPSECSGLGTQG